MGFAKFLVHEDDGVHVKGGNRLQYIVLPRGKIGPRTAGWAIEIIVGQRRQGVFSRRNPLAHQPISQAGVIHNDASPERFDLLKNIQIGDNAAGYHDPVLRPFSRANPDIRQVTVVNGNNRVDRQHLQRQVHLIQIKIADGRAFLVCLVDRTDALPGGIIEVDRLVKLRSREPFPGIILKGRNQRLEFRDAVRDGLIRVHVGGTQQEGKGRFQIATPDVEQPARRVAGVGVDYPIQKIIVTGQTHRHYIPRRGTDEGRQQRVCPFIVCFFSPKSDRQDTEGMQNLDGNMRT